jgi:hypothetical protein
VRGIHLLDGCLRQIFECDRASRVFDHALRNVDTDYVSGTTDAPTSRNEHRAATRCNV